MRTADRTLGWIASLLLLAASPAGADSFREEFDEPGGGPVGSTRFSVLLLTLNTGVARDPIDPGLGAPSTGGVLPVDEGGDSELRFYEALEPAAGSSYVLTPETTFTDVVVDAYVGVGFTDAFGVRSATVLVRATGDTIPTLDGYAAHLTHTLPGDSASLRLMRVDNGILQTLVSSDFFPVAPASENYRIVLRVIGDVLTAGVARVQAIGGQRVETPIDLDADPGLQTELTITDGALTAGAVGLSTFTRSTNSVFYDDVTVVDLVFTDGFESGDLSAWSQAVP